MKGKKVNVNKHESRYDLASSQCYIRHRKNDV